MSALKNLTAPDTMPDRTPEFYAVRQLLEDHPATRGLPWDEMGSLAQRAIDVIADAWIHPDNLEAELDAVREDLGHAKEQIKDLQRDVNSGLKELKKSAELRRKAEGELAALKAGAA